jgi:predicted metal-dependent phosphoesterase TrpH
MEKKKADLHMHTTASDGTETLEKRIKDAKEKGLDAIAVTDHDTFNKGLEKTKFIAENGLEVITGAEFKCQIKGHKIEILGYFLDPEEEKMKKLISELSKRRKERMEKFVNNLNDSYSLGLEFEDILERSEGNVGRPHLAEALIDKGVVDSFQEAFEKFIGSEKDEYVAVEKIDAKKVIDTVHENGGVTSLAHPGRSLTVESCEKVLRDLKDIGIDGLEVDYTYEEKRGLDSYSINFGVEKASELAKKFDLIETGGSDCHGSNSDKYFLGNIEVPYSQVQKLEKASR